MSLNNYFNAKHPILSRKTFGFNAYNIYFVAKIFCSSVQSL